MKSPLRKMLVLCSLSILLSSTSTFASYTPVYDKFYDLVVASCKRILQPQSLQNCDKEISICMTLFFDCSKENFRCIEKNISGDKSVACDRDPFDHFGSPGGCDGAGSEANTHSYNHACIPVLTSDKFASPGCNNGVVELDEDCDDGGEKPDKCPDDCKNAVALSGGFVPTTYHYGTVTLIPPPSGGLVPFSGDSGSAGSTTGGPSGSGTPAADSATVSGSGAPAGGGSSAGTPSTDSPGQSNTRSSAISGCSNLMAQAPSPSLGFWALGTLWILPLTLRRFRRERVSEKIISSRPNF